MLKTIKKKKEVRIDELFKYITMNAYKLLDDKEVYTFKSKYGTEVIIDEKGKVTLSFMRYTTEDLFTIEVEEEITEDTEFELLVDLFYDKGLYKTVTRLNSSINRIRDSNTVSIYALISGKLELIWERGNHGSN